MSFIETADDLDHLDLSRYEEMNGTSPEKSTERVTGYPVTVQAKIPSTQAKVPPMQGKIPQIPARSKGAISGLDHLLFRLERLMRPTKDLGSVLTTFNYGLYLLAYFDAKAHKVKSQILSLVTSHTGVTIEAEASPFAKLGAVVANARTTLRLFGLLPIYVQARKLMNNSKDMDKVLYAIDVIQCSLFATYQFLENVAFLMDSGVLSKRLSLGRMTGQAIGSVGSIYRMAHRAWFLGIVFDFARLLREAQIFFHRNHLDKKDITQEEAEKAAQWYYDWVRPLAWLPIGWQLSAWTEDSLASFNNLGVQGVAGVLADLRRTATLWHATKGVEEPQLQL